MTREEAISFIMRSALELCDSYDVAMAQDNISSAEMAAGTVNELAKTMETMLTAVMVMNAVEQHADTPAGQLELMRSGVATLLYSATLAAAVALMAPRLETIPPPTRGGVLH